VVGCDERPSLNAPLTQCDPASGYRFKNLAAVSAALPLVLSPNSLKNYAGTCGFHVPPEAAEALRRGGAGAQRTREYLSYRDVKKRPYVHLLDGGLSDNMGPRSLIEAGNVVGGLENVLKFEREFGRLKNVKKFVVLAVDAETTRT
jgi:NTE family protein